MVAAAFPFLTRRAFFYSWDYLPTILLPIQIKAHIYPKKNRRSSVLRRRYAKYVSPARCEPFRQKEVDTVITPLLSACGAALQLSLSIDTYAPKSIIIYVTAELLH